MTSLEFPHAISNTLSKDFNYLTNHIFGTHTHTWCSAGNVILWYSQCLDNELCIALAHSKQSLYPITNQAAGQWCSQEFISGGERKYINKITMWSVLFSWEAWHAHVLLVEEIGKMHITCIVAGNIWNHKYDDSVDLLWMSLQHTKRVMLKTSMPLWCSQIAYIMSCEIQYVLC